MITKQTKILVLGCGGMLGAAVYAHFKDVCEVYATDKEVNESWLHYLDIQDYAQVKAKIIEIKPDYIFNLAALTDMEYCETHPLEAYGTNAMGTENVALLCREFDIPMIYISTAGVFDGKQERYGDYDLPNPLSIYGKSKYAGEKFVKEFLTKYFIFRPGWMMGGGPQKDKKFINKVIKQIKEGNKELFVVDDKVGAPTYTYDFAKIIHQVIDTGQFGLYNSVCEDGGSRHEIAQELLRLAGLSDKIKLTKVESSHFRKEYFAQRPASEHLLNFKLKLIKITTPRSWKECLAEYMKKYEWGI